MASISNDKNGTVRILFALGGDRHPIRLGKQSAEFANEFKTNLERLIEYKKTGEIIDPNSLTKWLAGLSPKLHAKLCKFGLAAKRKIELDAATIGAAVEAAATAVPTIDQFVRKYITDRANAKEIEHSTQTNLWQAHRYLVAHFGKDLRLDGVTAGHAAEFRRKLSTDQKLSENTIRRMCGRARQLFAEAVAFKLIADNPFGSMKKLTCQDVPGRKFFVTADMSQKVLDACPNYQWRLIFSLARWGGLRCPSEHLALKSSDIDWERGRMFVRSKKTKRYAGKESRWVPIFPELLPHLEAAQEAAEEKAVYVIPKTRDATTNWRTQMQRIIQNAGLSPWPKLFQNLRSTRETELTDTFPAHVVVAWLGNSIAVATKHYFQVTDAHFDRASGGGAKSGADCAQHEEESRGTALPEKTAEDVLSRKKAVVLGNILRSAIKSAPPQGLEPWTSGLTVRSSFRCKRSSLFVLRFPILASRTRFAQRSTFFVNVQRYLLNGLSP